MDVSEDEDAWKIVWESYPRLVPPPLPGMPPLPTIQLPQVNPDRRACAGCVGPGGVAELQRRLRAAEAEVERLRRYVRRMGPPLQSRDDLQDYAQSANERAYDALMAEREKRKRAGRVIGANMRLHAKLQRLARSRVADAESRAAYAEQNERIANVRANSVPLLEDKIARLKADNLRLLNNEAPLRAGYLEACAERDELRKRDGSAAVEALRKENAELRAFKASTYAQAQMNDAGAFEKLRELLAQEKRGHAAKSQQLAVVDRELRSDDRPRKIIKRLRGFRIA